MYTLAIYLLFICVIPSCVFICRQYHMSGQHSSSHRGAAVDIFGPHAASKRKQISNYCGTETTNASWNTSNFWTASADMTRYSENMRLCYGLKSSLLLSVTPCSLTQVYWHRRIALLPSSRCKSEPRSSLLVACFSLFACLTYSSTFKLVAIHCSETSVNFY